MQNPSLLNPHQYWQRIDPAGTHESDASGAYRESFPASLGDGRQLLLPIRERDAGRFGLASLIINQASFSVLDVLASELAEQLSAKQIELIVGVPTLGLTLAEATARKLGHERFIALSTSRKFWYDDALSVPMSSITSPGQQKQLYLDPRLLPLLDAARIAVIDDVVSTGSSMAAALTLLSRCGVAPVCIGCAMRQSQRWINTLMQVSTSAGANVFSPLSTPTLVPHPEGGWAPESNSLDDS